MVRLAARAVVDDGDTDDLAAVVNMQDAATTDAGVYCYCTDKAVVGRPLATARRCIELVAGVVGLNGEGQVRLQSVRDYPDATRHDVSQKRTHDRTIRGKPALLAPQLELLISGKELAILVCLDGTTSDNALVVVLRRYCENGSCDRKNGSGNERNTHCVVLKRVEG